MAYKYETNLTSPNSSTRAAYGHSGKPTGITIHHWGLDGQNHDTVAQFLCRSGGNTSAHYVVSAGRVTCIVDPDRAAWHSGSTAGNGQTIGIECRPEMSAGDWATLVELIADLEDGYGSMKIYPHSYWSSTACPGRYGPKLDQLVTDVNALHAARKKGSTATAAASSKTPAKTPSIKDLSKTQFPTAVKWAVGKGVLTAKRGKGKNEFEPLAPVNRQDLAVALHRMNQKGL